MINFEFDDAHSSVLDLRLESLFLTLDSLVLMILQVRIHSHSFLTEASETMLARAEERRALLFWHVYELNAFHSLDCKSISRIQDGHVDFADQLSPPHRVSGYLDAILTLIMIARSIIQTLCSTRAKQKGVRLDEIQSLYQKLHH